MTGSLLDESALASATESCEAVVHLAALGSVPRSVKDPVRTHNVNATGTLLVLEAARRVGAHVVFSSSSSVYGRNPELPKRESMTPMPLSPYAVSKLSAEQYVCSYGTQYDLPVLPFRFFNVYGPYQRADHVYAAVIPRFLDAALAGKPVTIYGDGTQTRDFTFVGDVVRIIVMALENKTTAAWPVNLAFGRRISLNDLVTTLEDILGQEIERVFEPSRPGDVPHSQADNTELTQLFGASEPAPFIDGLRSTVDWFRSLLP